MAALPFRARWLGALVVAFVLAVPAAIHPAPAGSEGQSRGSIYLFLGGVGGIFSTGLDDLRDELRARGVPATALSYVGWRSVADQIEAGYAADKRALPVVIVGHSFGGDAALRVSAELGRHGIPVALVVIFDATNGNSGRGQRPAPDQLLFGQRHDREEAVTRARLPRPAGEHRRR
jgi:hypothetical protein